MNRGGNRVRQVSEYTHSRRRECFRPQALESVQWRMSLHSVYVANIAQSVSPKDIWRLFSKFGVVVDVFLSNVTYHHRMRYAFVRYRYRDEFQRAILEGSKQLVAGRRLRVGPANVRKNDRYQERRSFPWFKHEWAKAAAGVGIKRSEEDMGCTKGYRRSEYRTGSQVVVQPEKRLGIRDKKESKKGSKVLKDKDQPVSHKQPVASLENITKAISETQESADESEELVTSTHKEEVMLDVQISVEDLEWLFKSAVALLDEEKDVKSIQEELTEAGLHVIVRRIDGTRFLLTFGFEEEMKSMAKSPLAVLRQEFTSITPWVMTEEDHSVAVWVQLMEVPLELWHLNFFRALGNKWGEFLELDDCTEKRLSFEVARMKILVKSRTFVPSMVVGKSLGLHFRIPIRMEEAKSSNEEGRAPNDGANLAKATQTMQTTIDPISPAGDGLSLQNSESTERGCNDDSLTLIMTSTGITASSPEQDMASCRIPNELFVEMCSVNKLHGEVGNAGGRQSVGANLNFDWLFDFHWGTGPKETYFGLKFQEQCFSVEAILDEETLHVDPIREENTQTQETILPEFSLDKFSSLSKAIGAKGVGAGIRLRRGCRKLANSSKSVGVAQTRAAIDLAEPTAQRKRRQSKVDKQPQATQPFTEEIRASCELSGSAETREATTQVHDGPELSTKGVRQSKPKQGRRKKRTGISDEAAEISGISLSDEDIHNRNKILREAEAIWGVSDKLGLKFSKEKKDVVKCLVALEQQEYS